MRPESRPCRGSGRAARRFPLSGLPALLAAVLLLAACGLVDLRPFTVTTYPAEAETILPSAPSVWVEFPVAVDHAVVEPLLSVTADGLAVSGDLAWTAGEAGSGERLTFTPVSPFAPGVRHILRLSGAVRAVDGRTFNENVLVPFYVSTDSRSPTIVSASPGNGAVVDTLAPLVLTFSAPMDAAKFRDAFSVSPSVGFTVTWNPTGTAATVTPAVRWAAETLYTWTVGTASLSQEGVALGRSWSGTFLVQSDATAPAVLSPGRAVVSGATVTPLPGGLSDLLSGDSIVLSFSEDVDQGSLQTAFSLSPAVSGTIRKLSPGSFAFVPAESWKMSQEYVLTISTALEDLAGNPLPVEYRQVFTPAIPVQSVTEVDLAGTISDSPVYTAGQLNNSSPYMINWTVGAPPDNALVLTVVLHFARPYDDAWKPTIAGAVRLAAWFPSTLVSPQVTQVSWNGGQTLSIFYTGFQRSANSPSLARVYYRLTVPSGPEQTGNQDGSYIQDPVTVLLESGSDS